MAGGVSAALARAWDTNVGTASQWWHLDGSTLQVATDTTSGATKIANLPDELIKGHYRFCNAFIWPVMHDLGQFATFNPDDKQQYDLFNDMLGWCILRASDRALAGNYFIQDYQLAPLPRYMRDKMGARSLVFWHIPWPKEVAAEFVEPIADLVKGLLASEGVGFHTQEYAENFLRFIDLYMPEYSVDFQAMEAAETRGLVSLSRARSSRTALRPVRPRGTRAIVAPLGIDFDNWAQLAARQDNTVLHPTLMRSPFILSVDRADYTKGVTNRIKAIDSFFEHYPEWQEKIVFAQICGKTRTGLDAFENYWNECRRQGDELQQKWSTRNWQPLLWLDKSFEGPQLALLYRQAEMMLVNPVRDGLNLTAKEYVACQGRDPGVLALSAGAGAWQELGTHAVTVEPADCKQMADSIHRSLVMNIDEKSWRIANLKNNIRNNTLSKWWNEFASLLNGEEVAAGSTAVG